MNQFAKGGLSVLKDLAKRQKLEQTQAKAPVPGMFSVLDQLIQNAHTSLGTSPQPGAVWNKYLQPGRIFSREGVDFPLKQEELEYSGLGSALRSDAPIAAGELIKRLRRDRPQFREHALREGYVSRDIKDANGEAEYGPFGSPGLSHSAPFESDLYGKYLESLTTSDDFGDYDHGHFTDYKPAPLSWHRSTKHEVPAVGTGRLVEEIQSDRHSDAAQKVVTSTPETAKAYNDDYENMLSSSDLDLEGEQVFPVRPGNIGERLLSMGAPSKRRGYYELRRLDSLREKYHSGEPLTSEEEALLEAGPTGLEESGTAPVPDAPFKSPAEYSGLELRKALARSVADNDNFLATVRGKDQNARYGYLDERQKKGQEFVYDQVIPGQLQKLARQYGIKYDPAMEAPVGNSAHEKPPQFGDQETVGDWLGDAGDDEFSPHPLELHSVGKWYTDGLGMPDTHPDALKLKKTIKNYTVAQDELQWQSEHGASDAWIAQKLKAFAALDEVRDQLTKLEARYNNNQYVNHKISGRPKKDFPSLMLDEATREKIRKAGIPLWALGAGITGLEGLEGGDQGPEQQNYAMGGLAQGFAKGSLASLKDFIKNNYSAQSMQAKRADRLFSEAPTASEMLAPKGLKLLVESPGKIALLKPHDFSKITKPMVTDWATQEELDRDWMEQMGHAAFLAQQIEKQGGQRAPPVMALGAHSKTGRLTSTAHDGRRSSVAMALLGAGNIPTIMYRHDPRGVYQGQRGSGKESGYIVHDHYDPTDNSIGQYDPASFLDPGDLGDLQSANGGKLTIMPQNGQTPHYLTKPVGPYTFPRPLVDYDGPLFAKGGKVARLKELAKTAAAANWRDESWSSPEWNDLQRRISEDNPEHLAMPEHLNNNFLNAAAGAPAQLADLAALVALGPTLGMGAYEAGHDAIRSIPGMDWSGSMSDKYDELYDREFADRKVAKPAGALEHLAEIGGNMGASLPVPSGAGSAELRGLRKFLSSIVEYTVPTIRPKPANYAHGIIGGSLIQGAMNPIVSGMEDTRPSVHQFLQPHAAL